MKKKNDLKEKIKEYKKIEAVIKKAFNNVDKYIQKDLNTSAKVNISFR